MSDTDQKRPQLSDSECIQMQFGSFLQFLQGNGIPTPSKAELRQLLYSHLYVEFVKQNKDFQNNYLESLRNKLPQVQQALKEFEDKNKPKEVVEEPKEE